MSKVKKRVRPTKEQWHELNRLLDDVVKIGHINIRVCDCESCTKLRNYSKSIGLLNEEPIDNKRWAQRKLETKYRHQKDAFKIMKLANQGYSRIEIAKDIKRSENYVNKLIVEFKIEVKKLKQGRPRKK